MSRTSFLLVAILLWVAPAVVAGMLGWPGIWGGGSAFSDLIVPAPITGGILHVPSFVVTLLLVRAYGKLTLPAAGVMRAGFLAAALLGAAQLVDLDRLYLSLTTDMQASGFRLHRNYVGLCLLTDAAIAWTWLTISNRVSLRRPVTVAIALLPAMAYVLFTLSTSKRAQQDFLPGRADFAEQRGDGAAWVFTRLSPDDPGFRERALQFMEWRGPDNNVNYQDLAVYFTNSLHTARESGSEEDPDVTLCLYEDGTPTAWHTGRGDCFSGHENFIERLDRLYDDLPGDLPGDVKNYRVALEICADVTVPENFRADVEEINYCRFGRFDEKREELVRVHGEAALEEMLKP